MYEDVNERRTTTTTDNIKKLARLPHGRGRCVKPNTQYRFNINNCKEWNPDPDLDADGVDDVGFGIQTYSSSNACGKKSSHECKSGMAWDKY